MSNIAPLSRRNFIAAAAALALAAPALALADEKKDDKAAEPQAEGVELAGTWVMIAADCNDDEAAALLAFVIILATTTYEFADDGTVKFKIQVAESSDSDTDSETDSAAEALTGEDAADAEQQAADEVGDFIANTEQEGTWEQVSDTELVVTTGGDTANLTLDGLSLVSVEQDEGIEITSIFARPEDVLSGAWAIATYPDTYDAAHEGIEGTWSLVAMEGMGKDELEDAKWSAMLGVLGISITMEVAQDGTFVYTSIAADADKPDVSEGTWEEKGDGVYTFDDGTEPIEVKIVDSTMRLEIDDAKVILAPLA